MEPLFRTVVAPYRLGELLLHLAERGVTGRLLLHSDLGERTVYLHDGFPVFAHSSQFADRLGAVGVRYGMLTREQVGSALALARERGCELGRALLELRHVDGCQLFHLLSAQLVEQLASSCGATPARARFYDDPAALAKVVILRVHPMTAVLAAVRHLPGAEHDQLFAALADQRVAHDPLPLPARAWLADLGFLGDPSELVTGEQTTVGVLRSRMVAKLRPTTYQDFDPSASPIPVGARKADSVRPPARDVADYLTLALLLAGAIRVREGSEAREPLRVVPQAQHSPPDGDTAQQAIRLYLTAPREPRIAARTAIWGPAAEVPSDVALNKLLTLYLTLKPEPSPADVLGVAPDDPPAALAASHATYRAFLARVAEELSSPLARARIAELQACVDAALRELAPDLLPDQGTSAPQPPVPASTSSRPPPPSMPPDDLDALLRNVEARVREGNLPRVLELLEPVAKGRALPPTLSLARTLAQREVAARTPRSRSLPLLGALLLGALAGYALRAGGLP